MPDAKELVLTRSFPAPRALVFQAWSTAAHIKQWFAPEHYTVPEAEVDFRTGGVFAVCMRAPDGTDHWSRGTFTEVVPPERLGFVGGLPDMENPGVIIHTAVSFEDDGGGTRITVRQRYDIRDPAFMRAVDGAPEGWRTTLDKLAREVARMQGRAEPSAAHGSFTIERIYKATPAQVFHALTDIDAKARWFAGGDDWTLLERSMDARPGGRERLRGRWANGTETLFDAVYFNSVPERRLIYAYDMWMNGRKLSVSLATVQLSPEGTGTRLTVTEQGVFLDAYVDAGARETGTGVLLDRLGASLAA